MSISNLYPEISPSLLLDFANVKKLDPRVTFARASGATYYDGKTVAKAEENLVLYSQEFDNAAWLKFNATVTANAIAAPDGTLTADLITSTSTSESVVYRTSSYSGTHTQSVFAKKGTGQYLIINTNNPVKRVWFDLDAGTVANAESGVTGTITNAGNGWYRCTAISDSPNRQSFFVGNSSTDFSSSVGLTLYIWGAQLEQRSAVTAYTPTTSQPITNYIPVLQTASANVARFDHDPVTGESLGLLVEEQRTNLLTYSEDFANAAWFKLNCSITSNTTVAPDGTLTADKAVENTASALHHVSWFISAQIGNIQGCFSVYLKYAGRRYVVLRIQNSSASTNYFGVDLLEKTLTSTPLSAYSAQIEDVGNDWIKVSLVDTWNDFSGDAPGIYLRDTPYTGESGNSGIHSYTGDGYSGIYIWGAQLEAGSFPTSYIKTEASQVTRSADFASMTGTNFSDWYRQDEGTLFVEASARDLDLIVPFMTIDNNFSNSNEYRIMQVNSAVSAEGRRIVGVSRNNGAIQGRTPSADNISGNFKAAFAYRTNDFAGSFNGNDAVTDNNGVLATGVNYLWIGTRAPQDTFTNNPIRKLAYYPARLTNEQLQSLTS